MSKSDLPKIIITSPVREREECIVDFLEGINRLEYPRNRVKCLFLINNSKDNTEKYILDYIASHKDFPETFTGNLNVPDPDLLQDCRNHMVRRQLYSQFVLVRNKIIDLLLSPEIMKDFGDWDYQFSLDSDIIVKPGLLNALLDNIGEYDIFANVIENDYGFGATGNVLDFDIPIDNFIKEGRLPTGIHYYLPTLPFMEPFDCFVTGACCLIKRLVLKSGICYEHHNMGEDTWFCMNAHKKGLKVGALVTGLSEHRMYERYRVEMEYRPNDDPSKDYRKYGMVQA